MRISLMLIAAAPLASCAPTAPQIEVRDPWARATAPGQPSGAIYATIVNRGSADRLVGVASDAGTAMREFKSALALAPADRASAHCDLGEAYLLAGRGAEAKKEALAALEIAPTFERGQELLLKAIKTVGPGAP